MARPAPWGRRRALGRLAGLELWGGARGEHAALISELGATPIDYQREDFARVLPGGFDVVFDGPPYSLPIDRVGSIIPLVNIARI